MQFDNIEKFRTKVDSSYLLVKTQKGSSLCWIRVQDNWGLSVLPLLGGSEPELIEDARLSTKVIYKSPPVGYMNSSKLKCAIALTRIPIRSFKTGLTNDNTSVKVVSTKEVNGYRLGDVLSDDDYRNFISGFYPSYDYLVRFLKNGGLSCVLTKDSAVKLNNFGIPILEVGGYNVGWWGKGLFKPAEGVKEDVVSQSLKINLNELGEALKNV